MSVDWPIVSIDEVKADIKGSIAIGPFGSRMKSDCYEKVGIPVIRGTNLTGGLEFKGEFVYISKEKADTLGSSNVYQNDLVFPHRGSIGEVGIILQNERYVLSSSLMKLTCNKEKVNPQFLYYFFRSYLGRYELLKNASQVGTPGIGQPLASLKSIKFKLPPLDIQSQIVKKLQSIDRKITLNHKTNQTLEQIAQALFKSWFVDFDPTRAKIAAKQAGQDPERAAMAAISGKTLDELDQLSSAQLEQLKTTAALFPDGLVDSELGEVPEGWKISCLGNFIKFTNGKSIKADEEGRYPVYGANGIIGKTENVKFSNAVIIGRVGAYCGAVIYSLGDFWASDNTIVASSKNDNDMLPYIFYQLQILNLNKYAGGAAQPLLNQTALKSIEVIFSSEELIFQYNILVHQFFKTTTSNAIKNVYLENIRDTLLPKLLSGELSTNQSKVS